MRKLLIASVSALILTGCQTIATTAPESNTAAIDNQEVDSHDTETVTIHVPAKYKSLPGAEQRTEEPVRCKDMRGQQISCRGYSTGSRTFSQVLVDITGQCSIETGSKDRCVQLAKKLEAACDNQDCLKNSFAYLMRNTGDMAIDAGNWIANDSGNWIDEKKQTILDWWQRQ